MQIDDLNDLYPIIFYYKSNKAKFQQYIDDLLSRSSSSLFKLNLFHYVFEICRKTSRRIAEYIFESLALNDKIELTHFLSFYEPEFVKKFYELLFVEQIELTDLCFINAKKFLKTMFSSKVFNFRTLDESLAAWLYIKCYEMTSNVNVKIKCLEKLSNISTLTDSQLELLDETFDKGEHFGVILDIFLRTDRWDLIKKAHNKILDTNKPYFESDYSVHFFEPNFSLGIENEKTDVIDTLREFTDIVKLVFDESQKTLEFLSFIINDNFSYKGLTLKQTFNFVWRKLEGDRKRMLIEDIIYGELPCAYGLFINLLSFVEDGLVMNPIYAIKEDLISKIKDPMLWLDEERLRGEIEKNELFLNANEETRQKILNILLVNRKMNDQDFKKLKDLRQEKKIVSSKMKNINSEISKEELCLYKKYSSVDVPSKLLNKKKIEKKISKQK